MSDDWRAFEIKVCAGKAESFCRCRKSQKMPYCDGKHTGTGIHPLRVCFAEDTTVYICGCGKSKNGIFCDGSNPDCP